MLYEDWSTSPGKSSLEIFPLFSPVATGWQKSTRNTPLFETAPASLSTDGNGAFCLRTYQLLTATPAALEIVVKLTVKYADMLHDNTTATVGYIIMRINMQNPLFHLKEPFVKNDSCWIAVMN